MTALPERQQFVEWLNHAVASGARKAVAGAEIGLSLRSLQRWAITPTIQANERTTTLRPRPLNALSEDERRAILRLLPACHPARSCQGWPSTAWVSTLVLHSDNGAPIKPVTLLSKLYDLGITPSHGRPRVSNDNPYSESLFRTLKYCPQWPRDGFADLDAARSWGRDFIRGYNHEHRHSRIRFVTPAPRHRGEDQEVLTKSHALYQQARNQHPHRGSGNTRNWQPIGAVTLNPERLQPALRIAA